MNNTFTAKFNLAKEPELSLKLEENGFSFREVPHAFWQAQKNGLSATLYKSGKLLVQGKEAENFAKEFLAIETAVQTALNLPEAKYKSWIGTDESGKGDYFGPLLLQECLLIRKTYKNFPILTSRTAKNLMTPQ